MHMEIGKGTKCMNMSLFNMYMQWFKTIIYNFVSNIFYVFFNIIYVICNNYM